MIIQEIDCQMDEKFDRYRDVSESFAQFFNAEELKNQFDKKAEIQDLKELQKHKANKKDIEPLNLQIKDFNDKLKHMSVYVKELSLIMVPSKHSGKFNCNEDLN